MPHVLDELHEIRRDFVESQDRFHAAVLSLTKTLHTGAFRSHYRWIDSDDVSPGLVSATTAAIQLGLELLEVPEVFVRFICECEESHSDFSRPFPIRGSFVRAENRIEIRADLDEITGARTALHEIHHAHEYRSGKQWEYREGETRAKEFAETALRAMRYGGWLNGQYVSRRFNF